MSAGGAVPEPAAAGSSRLDGWRAVIAGFVGLTFINGVRACFGLFLPFMVADMGFSLTYGSAIFWLHWTAYSIGCVVLGGVIDRAGVPVRLIGAGAAAYACSLLLLPFASSGWQVFLLFGLIGGLGGSVFGSVPTNVSVSRWFVRRRGVALGISNTGVGFGVTVLPLVAGLVISLAGWRAGWGVLGVLAGVLMIPLARWFAAPSEAVSDVGLPSADPSPPTQFRTVSFWALCFAFLFGLVAQYGTFVHLPGQALGLGLTATEVATGMMLAGLANIAARLAFGWIADRLTDRSYVVLPGTALFLVGVLLAGGMTDARDFFVVAGFVGAGVAVYGPLYGMVVADRFPKEILGRTFGALTVGAGVGGAGGPVVVGALLDAGAAYETVWRLMAVVATLAVPLFFVRRAPRLWWVGP